jgi:phospholipid/cholesterol/gamma-HCH transport system ATP-binding protein
MNIEDILSEQESIVEVDNVSVSFGKQDVLRNISLSIPPGQTLALLGESGCGKTVLMKSIIGLVQPTLGTVSFDGQDINLMNDRQLSHERLRFGFVFQNAALFDSMTIGQNVAFPLRQHGRFSDQQIREMVLSRLSEVGLPDSVVYKKPAELSGGMRKRVGLARALIMNPELIMYDEPTTGLDPIMSDVINELIIRTRRRNPVTSIVVTHDMNTAHKVADRVVMLMPVARLEENESQIIFDGTVAELDACRDRRVQQFINGEAGERLMELRGSQSGGV